MKACDSIDQLWAGFWSSTPGLGDNICFSNHCWSLVTSTVSERGIHTISAGSTQNRKLRKQELKGEVDNWKQWLYKPWSFCVGLLVTCEGVSVSAGDVADDWFPFFRLRVSHQSCFSAGSWEPCTWETTCCSHCPPGWESWRICHRSSCEGTAWSACLWSWESAHSWNAVGSWWRRTCSTPCPWKSKNACGGQTKSKLEPQGKGKSLWSTTRKQKAISVPFHPDAPLFPLQSLSNWPRSPWQTWLWMSQLLASDAGWGSLGIRIKTD